MINVSDRTSRAHTPVPEDLRPFAIETINTVIKISKKFDESNPFCTTLCGVLWSIMTELQKQHQDYNTTQSKKVESLLNNLERLCSVCLCYICLREFCTVVLSMEICDRRFLAKMLCYHEHSVKIPDLVLSLTYIHSGPRRLKEDTATGGRL